jgi:hypothetical protein
MLIDGVGFMRPAGGFDFLTAHGRLIAVNASRPDAYLFRMVNIGRGTLANRDAESLRVVDPTAASVGAVVRDLAASPLSRNFSSRSCARRSTAAGSTGKCRHPYRRYRA